MNQLQSSEAMWQEWLEVQRRAVRAMARADLAAAIVEVEEYLRREPGADLRGEALGFRASLREDNGEFAEARQDLLAALSLSQTGSYQRYTLELALGNIEEKLGEHGQAASWYLQALATVAEDPTTSGGSALLRLLQLQGTHGLRPHDRTLADRVAQKSWKLLLLEGEPDLEDLTRTAELLVEAQGQPLPASDE